MANPLKRLMELEGQRPPIKYPTFSQMYDLQKPEKYLAYMVDSNPGVTRQQILDLGIKHLSDLY